MRFLTCCIVVAFALLFILLDSAANGQNPAVVPAAEAKHHLDQVVTVEMEVRSTGRSRKDNLLFLNTHENFRSNENFALVFSPSAQSAFKSAGINDIEKHYFRKLIHVTGTVRHYKSITDMQIEKPSQIKVIRTLDDPPKSTMEIPQTMEDPVIATSPYFYLSLGAIGAGVVLFAASRIFAYYRRRKEEAKIAAD